ncbi:uncharacterized protein LOC117222547 isoform X2 [Megalopta genalis]|uniref:uncharacterized protein LOC117222547 isoform X2 n=1 Tax=Megalopta genalis TaxID=115081 RepID=UPI003FCFEB74
MRKRTTRTRDFKDQKGCLLFRATDFASLMRPIMFFSGIFGFFPCNYKSEEYVFSKKKFVYSIIIICLHLVLQVHNFLLINFFDTSSPLTQSMPENFFVLLDGSLPLLLFAAPFSMIAMFEQLSKVSRTLSRPDYSAMAKVIHTVYIVNVVYYVISTPINYWSVMNLPVRRRLVNLYLAMSSTMTVMCYVSCVSVLGACFKKLNGNLKQLNGSSRDLRTELAEKQLSQRRSTMLLTKIWFCETAANHATEITTTIHDCVSSCADDTVKRELKCFALQVMHRDITFTTKAFDINGKLLSQILSAIFTYMMILYQFLTGSNCTN